jgi:hypothetical protein
MIDKNIKKCFDKNIKKCSQKDIVGFSESSLIFFTDISLTCQRGLLPPLKVCTEIFFFVLNASAKLAIINSGKGLQ